jgi:hypothetical protein
MVETKLSGPSMAERIANRMRNSGQGSGTNPSQTVSKGEGPTRVHHNLHFSATQSRPMNKRTESDGGEER